MQGRILYFDSLKGFAILFVVYNHLVWFGMKDHTSLSCLLFNSVCMNLFIVLSGRLASKIKDIQSIRTAIHILTTRSRNLLIPALLWIFISSYLWHQDLATSFLSDFKNGYWFTYVLFSIFFIECMVYLFAHSLKLTKRLISIANLVISFLLYLCSICLVKYLNIPIGNFLSLSLIFKYLVFFAIGLEYPFLSNCLSKIRLNPFAMLFVVALSFCFLTGYTSNFLDFLRVYLIIIFFRESKWLNTENILYNVLSFFGKNSLQIYFIHFFFLFNLQDISLAIHKLTDAACIKGNSGCNLILEMIVILPLAVIIATISIEIYRIISKSSILDMLLFGKINNNKSFF